VVVAAIVVNAEAVVDTIVNMSVATIIMRKVAGIVINKAKSKKGKR
jgi:hypothetical protein